MEPGPGELSQRPLGLLLGKRKRNWPIADRPQKRFQKKLWGVIGSSSHNVLGNGYSVPVGIVWLENAKRPSRLIQIFDIFPNCQVTPQGLWSKERKRNVAWSWKRSHTIFSHGKANSFQGRIFLKQIHKNRHLVLKQQRRSKLSSININ